MSNFEQIIASVTGGDSGAEFARKINENFNKILVSKILVTAPTGSIVTCTKGSVNMVGTEVSGTWTFDVGDYGIWTVTATLGADTTSKTVEVSEVKQYSVTLIYAADYGFRINTADSNPLTSVTYLEGTTAYGMTKGSSEWDSMPIFKDIRPVYMTNGNITSYLNKNNFSQDTNGNSVTITSDGSGDVMIEIPKFGYKFSSTGNYIDVYITERTDASSEGYVYHPFSYANEGDCNHIYIGAFLGYNVSNILRSVSGVTPTASITIGTARTYAKAHGTGYGQLDYFKILAIQLLYILKYGNLDSQTALGQGYVGGSGGETTGVTLTNGMNYGSTSQTSRVKLFGIEDFWGNLLQWCDGLYCNTSYQVLTSYPAYGSGFNDTGAGYKFNTTSGNSANMYGFVTKVIATNESGFIPKTFGGSSSTFFADNGSLSSGYLPSFGGFDGILGHGASAGAFGLSVSGSASSSVADVGARLSYNYVGK